MYNGTLTGASWAAVNTNSSVQKDVAATAISGGTVIHSFPVSAGNTASNVGDAEVLAKIPFALDAAGSSGSGDIVSIVCTSITGSNAPTNAFINWVEVH